jgi:nitrogen fixation protein NifU and related proteins
MSDMRELYRETILDHNKNPRNFRRMEHADAVVDGFNPLCGDHYTIYLKFDGDRISEISFEGSGCAISKASASVMCTVLKNKSRGEAEAFFHRFHDLITGKLNPEEHAETLGKLSAFSGVCEFPSRVKCAGLAWHAVHSAVTGGQQKTVSTE